MSLPRSELGLGSHECFEKMRETAESVVAVLQNVVKPIDGKIEVEVGASRGELCDRKLDGRR